ncbi:hypothetical protein FOL47_003123 [Perkinsus chesapeaki]|uniref:Uncharacterized protein n=1 Tax=Perkinsus chesapeaki TaxID=330153 RepID=A0A7J6M9K8_PERCH|nr:hypothetical protein FOL47_003123 [Perkinsus chesapeaki]
MEPSPSGRPSEVWKTGSGVKFQSATVQKRNVSILFKHGEQDHAQLGLNNRYFLAFIRVIAFGLNTWLIVYTFIEVYNAVEMLNLMELLLYGYGYDEQGMADQCKQDANGRCFKNLRILIAQVVIELGSLSYMLLRFLFLLGSLLCGVCTRGGDQRQFSYRRAGIVLEASRTMVYISGVSTLMFSPSPRLLQTIWNSMDDFYMIYFSRAMPIGNRNGEGGDATVLKLDGVAADYGPGLGKGSLVRRGLFVTGRLGVLLLFGVVVACSCFFLLCKLTSLSFAIKHNVFSKLRLLPLVTYIGALNQLAYVKDTQWNRGASEQLYQSYRFLFAVAHSENGRVEAREADGRKKAKREDILLFRTRIVSTLLKEFGFIRGFLLSLSLEVRDEAFVAHHASIKAGVRHRPKLQSSPSLGWRSVSPGSHVVYDNDHRGGSDREQQSRKLKCLADLHACTTNFQPSWVQVTNLRLLVDYERNKLWRIGDAAFRLLTVCLNTGFIAFTFYQAMDSISGLNLLTVLAFGRNEAVKKAGAAPPDCDHPSMFNEQECFSYVRILLVQVVIELLAIVIMWAQLLVAIATSRNLLRIKVTMLHISGFSTLLFSPSNMLVQDLWRFVWTHLGPRYIEPAPAAGVTRLHRRQGVLASRLEVNMLKLVAILTWSVKALLTTVVFAVILLLTASFLICKLTSLSFAIADSSLRLALFPILSYVAALNQLSYAMDVQWSDGALEHLYQSYPWLDSVTKGSRHPYVTGLRAARRRRRAQVTVFRRRILEGLIKLHGRVLGSLLALSITVQDEAFIAYFPANAAAGRRL